MADEAPTKRTRLRRSPTRGCYDRAAIDAILDGGVLCHVGYVIDGQPMVTPTLYWREGDRVYWHGSSASNMLRAAEGAPVCLTVSHLDGLVLARSGFHHSVNYRSVMLLGEARIEDTAKRPELLDRFIEELVPGRAATLRQPTEQELKATTILSIAIDEVSAKVRTGGPIDEPEDYELPIWAGVVPLHQTIDAAIPDDRLLPGVELPEHVTSLSEVRWAQPASVPPA
ncbi:MAG: pyridoxamine 5'-phosphate oxidase family protein [Chloroflexi bacterium]|nr:pyridoxamine 5'-phosphate oxidase family protein [Chloroflexota bacterium]MDA1146400.1 pyridoxamine 5'-phosphate oxidase family protein [Chloroflexota bacterium]MQC82271.1 pyridoxamine 5'-phosphate oxidase family protein [Chloroflexota bacterium]MQC82670.1 pyridoxamine 5'-phosphate oxidase family protein [Chloroflexota bacterium]PKB56498.1 MAG: flavin-nucleotide-binding protein [SAR202 cluster bacterium Casp-Chloro-G1]